jgi:hypothetical protein
MRFESLLAGSVLVAISTISFVVPTSAMTHSAAGAACAATVNANGLGSMDQSGSTTRHRRQLYISCMRRHGFRA